MRCLVVIAHPVHDIVVEFPMTVTGKIQKFMLRKEAADDLGLGGHA
jgi:acyl-coenzyme A synthetase/AMP-(fatty) acid ligase